MLVDAPMHVVADDLADLLVVGEPHSVGGSVRQLEAYRVLLTRLDGSHDLGAHESPQILPDIPFAGY
jgi:hypothetical protein